MTIVAVQQSPLENFPSREHYFSSTYFPPLMSDSLIATVVRVCKLHASIEVIFRPHHIFTV